MNGIKNASLLAINRPVIADIELKKEQYLVSSSPAEIPGYKLLCVYIYGATLEIEFSIYLYKDVKNLFAEKSPCFTTYDHINNKWREACIFNLFGCYWDAWYKRNEKFIYDCEQSEKAGSDYFNEPFRQTLECVGDFQSGLRDYRLKLRMDNDHRQIDAYMAQIPDLPTDLDTWLNDVVLKQSRYIYYYRKKKTIYGFCTYCRREITFDAPKGNLINKEGVCPDCGSEIIFKSKNNAAVRRDTEWFTILNRINDGIIITEYKAVRIHDRHNYIYGYEQCIFPEFRVFISMKLTMKGYTYESRNCKFCNSLRWYHISDIDNYTLYHPLYPYNITEAIKDTPWKYSALDLFALSGKDVNVYQYLNQNKHHPIIEKMTKLKLFGLVSDYTSRNNHFIAFKNGDIDNGEANIRVQDALETNMAEIRFISKIDADFNELSFIKYCRVIGRKCDEDEIKNIRKLHLHCGCGENSPWERLLPYTSINKSCKYISNQYSIDEQLKKEERHYKSHQEVLNDWRDYIKDCRKLGYDLHVNSILMPRILHEAHTGTSAAISTIMNQDNDVLIAGRLNELEEIYGYTDKEFFIRPARCSVEIVEEGRNMGHCVARYIDKMAKGDCTILFIRRVSDPDKSVATVEVDGAHVIQIRGYKNQIPEKEVEVFFKSMKRRY